MMLKRGNKKVHIALQLSEVSVETLHDARKQDSWNPQSSKNGREQKKREKKKPQHRFYIQLELLPATIIPLRLPCVTSLRTVSMTSSNA